LKIDEVIKSSSGGNGIDIILVLVKILRTKTVVEKRIILSTTTIERATMMGLKEMTIAIVPLLLLPNIILFTFSQCIVLIVTMHDDYQFIYLFF